MSDYPDAMLQDAGRRDGLAGVHRRAVQGETHQLKVGENVIGRGPENDLAIEDSSASRFHAMITVKDDEFVLFDLGARGARRSAANTSRPTHSVPAARFGLGRRH